MKGFAFGFVMGVALVLIIEYAIKNGIIKIP